MNHHDNEMEHQGEFVDAEFVNDTHHEDPAQPERTFVDGGEQPSDHVNDATDHTDVDGPTKPANQDQLNELFKFASDTAFAAVGFAGLVGEKAKAFYEDQKRQYAETHPDADRDPGAKDFLAQLREKVESLVEDLTKGYKDMAERGRASAAKADQPWAKRADAPKPDTSSVDGTEFAEATDDLLDGPISQDPPA